MIMDGQSIRFLRPDVDWQDEDRVGVLFSHFRPRTLNPESWDAKLVFWEETLTRWLGRKASCVFNIVEFEDICADVGGGRRPEAIETVVQEMVKSGDLVTETSMLEKFDLQGSSWGRWFLMMAAKGAAKAVGTIYKSEPDLRRINFVSTKNLEDLTSKSLSAIKSRCNEDYVIKYSSFVRLENVRTALSENGLDLSESTFNLVKMNLLGKKLIHVEELDGVKYLKLKNNDDKVGQLTDEEMVALKLWALNDNLEKEILNLERESGELRSKAKDQIKEGHRVSAKAFLRKRKQIERQLSRKSILSLNVSDMLSRIETMTASSTVAHSMREGLQVLKSQLRIATFDDVQDLMLDVTDCLDEVEEISQVISKPIEADAANDVDDDELLKELENMLESDKNEAEIVDRMKYLPSPSSQDDLVKREARKPPGKMLMTQ